MAVAAPHQGAPKVTACLRAGDSSSFFELGFPWEFPREDRMAQVQKIHHQGSAPRLSGFAAVRLALQALLVALSFAFCSSAAEPLVKLDLAGRTLEGTPLVSAQQKTFFLARDGQCVEFSTSEATNASQVAGGFKSYSQAEIRGLLLRE